MHQHSDPCFELWAGIKCSTSDWPVAADEYARVKEVRLRNRKLPGTVPAALGRLTALQSLDVSRNYLHGTLPTALRQMHQLEELQLSGNSFQMQSWESLSAILGDMPHLRSMDLGMWKGK